ncbi:hypothetical protein [Phenylobacterium sp.]|uniref:hypothetical protein n=1 Tax=Phenylobacterium sp. TaxID=1871053 RepID=UPI002C698B57|nr:hypothetical protein [Phenylobacterium sp.]HLZ75090.1 hypothetical protein [Phenylobacterium sp.]
MKLSIAAGLAGAVLVLSLGSGAAAQHAPKGCFLTEDLRSHTIAGKDTIYLNVNGVDTYEVKTDSACLAHATSHEPMVVKDLGLGKICHAHDLEVIVRGSRCHIASMTKLTEAAAAAIPKALQP